MPSCRSGAVSLERWFSPRWVELNDGQEWAGE